MAAYSKARLGSVLRHRKEFFTLDDTAKYKRVRVQLHNKGIVLRDIVEGAELKTKQQQRVLAGDLLVAEIDAKVGGFGIVPTDLGGAIVSSHYFLFEIDETECLRGWLDAFIGSGGLEDQVKARGSTNYAAIRPEHVLHFEIPLPPLPEQRRIVARIEELAARIEKARTLRQESLAELETVETAATASVFDNSAWVHISMEDLVGRSNLKNGKSLKSTTESSDVRCLMISSLRSGRIKCTDTKPVPMTLREAEPYLIRPQDVFVVRGNGSKRLVGRAGLIEDDCNGVIFPDLFIRVPLDTQKVVPAFFVAFWNSTPMRDCIEDVAKTTSGIWKINQGHIISFSIPVPPVEEQQRIVDYLEGLRTKVDALNDLHGETVTELDALLPSILNKALRGDL